MPSRSLDRDSLIVLGGVIGLAALAWLDLWRRAGDTAMGAAMAATMPRSLPWTLTDLGATALMWSVMMVAMMLPSALPMLLLYSGAEGRRRDEGGATASTSLFAAGYLLVWAAWSLVAATLQGALQALLLLLLSPGLATTSAVLGASFLLLAGGYQLTPRKDACLAHCQSPLGFLLAHWREGSWGALRMGLHHGAYCFGCCWALMGFLFVGGVMNLLWVATLAGFVLLEKVVARGPWLSRASGLLLIAWGVYVLFRGLAP